MCRPLRAAALAGCIACAQAAAYEYENAVPLAITADLAQVHVEAISVRLDARQVDVATQLRNSDQRAARADFFARTPIAGSLGVAEDHADKRFAELKASVDGRPIKLRRTRQRFAPGPMQAHTYRWRAMVPAERTITHQLSYSALPQFSLEALASDSMTRLIQSHCGDPARIRAALAVAGNEEQYVIAERYVVPVAYMFMRTVSVRVTQPPRNWLQARPKAILVCGLAEAGSTLQLAGQIEQAADSLDVLVISAPGADDAP
ncbi:MAG: hypothetical protein ACLGI6_14615 [Gammaproteobacteria bacterium]